MLTAHKSAIKKHPHRRGKMSSLKNEKIVFIVGAGLSSIVGFPTQAKLCDKLKKKFPNESNHDLYSNDIEQMITMIQIAAQNKDINLTYEDIPDYPIQVLLRNIKKILSEQKLKEENVSVIKNLINKSSLYKQSTFINLNWDSSLEDIINTMGMGVDYCVDFDYDEQKAFNKNKKIEVLKPHGCINWNYCIKCRRLSNSKGKNVRKEIFYSEDLHINCECENIHYSQNDEEMIIVPPTFIKETRNYPFDKIQRRVHQRIGTADVIVIIGYSLRESDYDMRYALMSAISADIGENKNLSTRIVIFGAKRNSKKIAKFFSNILTYPDISCYGFLDKETVEYI